MKRYRKKIKEGSAAWPIGKRRKRKGVGQVFLAYV